MTRAEALTALLGRLKALGYRFTSVTPATHARVIARSAPAQIGLRDVFGWNHPFVAEDVGDELIELLRAADALEEEGEGRLRSRLRAASLGEDLFLHSAFPTEEADAVFFGPDTYRFARFIERHLEGSRIGGWLADVGAGSGAGAIVAARIGNFDRISMVDVNEAALELAAVNASAAGVKAECVRADTVPDGPDVIIANPPYMVDPAARAYRDGGELLGGGVALDWVTQALDRLAPDGSMLLYTGAAFVNGEAPLLGAIEDACRRAGASVLIEELDPDVFGEELEQPSYAQVERIAAVGVVITR